MIGVINYGMGNLHSIYTKLKQLNCDYIDLTESSQISQCSKLILPGVGHFARGMKNLGKRRLIAPLNQAVLEKGVPILGICLGAQLICKFSEEGSVEGLNWINATVKKFDVSAMPKRLKTPHIGWNNVEWKDFLGQEDGGEFYFVHSYHMADVATDSIGGWTNYGYKFVSALRKKNIYGVQFHPEKSHRIGKNLLQKFLTI